VKRGRKCCAGRRSWKNSGGTHGPATILSKAGSEKTKYAGGVDGIQAVQLAMKMIGAYLNLMREEQAAELTWEGGDNGDVGFPD